MTRTAPSRLLRFGAFEVDLLAGELRKLGMKVKLQEKPFQVLALLLEHAGEVVTREELRQKLWPSEPCRQASNHGIRTRRVICPLLSQYVTLLERNGSSGAGWMLPLMSIARDRTVCSPRVGTSQFNLQNLHE